MLLFFKTIVDWIEVWALAIPLIIFMLKPIQESYLKPIIIYIFIAFIINLIINIIWKFKYTFNFPVVFQINTYFYTIHSIVRLFLLGWFFIILNQPFLRTLKKFALVIFSIFVIINFMFEPFINYWYNEGKLQSTISNKVLATEAAIMVFYCLQYYIYNIIRDDEAKRTPDFWIVTGLSVFSFCSFPIYFFYNAILANYRTFTINIWTVQKVSFLFFCICIGRAFYTSRSVKLTAVKTNT